ncbi:MAG TPA: WD40 repeat domain-containing protein [Polyangiaceae bacterium]|nr:WD40 repeat domain-containing protein [Polyangiaceae bacterium]
MGCSPPHLDVADCEIGCTNDQGCLNGMVCLGNRCVSPSRIEACPENAGAGSTATTNVSLGGFAGRANSVTSNAGTKSDGGGAGTAGGGNTAGISAGGTGPRGGGGGEQPSLGGYGGTMGGGTGGIGGSQTGGAAGSCQITGTPPAEACTLRPYHADFEAGCPVDSFVWALTTTVDNLKLEKGDTVHPEVTGTPRDACIGCQLSLAVYPAPLSGNQIFPLQVYATPRITTAALPDACVDQLYDVALSGEGGDPAQYFWTANIPEDTGLSIQDGHLKGLITASGATPRDVSIELTVKDQHCASDAVRLTLHVLGNESTECPKILIEDTSPDWPAPPACRGQPYSLKVTAIDGSASYTWGHSSKPTGFDFNPLTRELKATSADEPGDFVVQASDQPGRVIQKTYRIDLRDKCWLGYVYGESTPQLRLFDPFLNTRKTFPTQLGATEYVVDFEFSPNGKSIVCHIADRDATKPKRLILIGTADMTERALDFDGSVRHFAWSSNSSTLAAAFGPDGSVNVGGVLFTNEGLTTGVLKPIAAPVDSPIVWFGQDQYIAFHSAFMPPGPMRAVHVSQLGNSGFGEFNSPDLTYYLAPLELRGAPSGFYVQAVDSSLLNYYSMSISWFAQHGNVAIPPNGALVGRAAEGALQLFTPESNSRDANATPSLSAPGCDRLLTWARKENRVACLGGDGKTINVFRFTLAPSTIDSAPITGEYNYGNDRWNGQQRMLSPKGKWLTFTTAYDLYIASLDVAPAVVTRTYPRVSAGALQGQSSAAIEYSPDEEWVAVEAHGAIAMCRTSQPTLACTKWLVHPKIADSCDETLLTGSRWCGSASNYHGIVWSPDSKLVGVERDDGSLQIMDMRMLQQVVVEDACTSDCVGKYQFQP